MTRYEERRQKVCQRFNTASGMRSHVTLKLKEKRVKLLLFQYRKRYEVTCDHLGASSKVADKIGFNTASGMRSHVTS